MTPGNAVIISPDLVSRCTLNSNGAYGLQTERSTKRTIVERQREAVGRGGER